MKLTLPLPITVNHYYGRNGNRTFLTKRGLQFRSEVFRIVKEAGLDILISEKIKITTVFYLPDKRKRDIDNFFKSLFDAIEKSFLIINDNQISEIHAYREVDKNNPRCEIEIEELK